jgi:uncharacterized membrane protein (UPF0127 family)
MNRRFFLVIGFLALTIYFVGFRNNFHTLKIISGDQTTRIHFEVAQTEEEKLLGLMGRSYLPEGHGMLFIYDAQDYPVMWMKDMLFPLDIVFIGADLKINIIQREVPPCEAHLVRLCDRYGSEEPSLYVLELPARYAEKKGFEKGDQVILPLGF